MTSGQSKPRVFIGSSKEAIKVANAVHANLNRIAEVTPWYAGAFEPNNYTLEDLETRVNHSDFAIFIFAADDVSKIRGKYYATVRDNTIFEMGLFMTKLGRERVFFILPDVLPETMDDTTIEGLRTPSDLFGVNPLTYEVREDRNFSAAVSVACQSIIDRIERLGIWTDYRLATVITSLEQEFKRKQNRLVKIMRLFREIIKTREVDDEVVSKISDTLRVVFASFPFVIRGVTIFRATEDQFIEQITGNVGKVGRKYPLHANDGKAPTDPERILVVDSHRDNKAIVNLHEVSDMEKEYLLCYPLAKRYVLTLHLLGDSEVEDAVFNMIDEENEQLLDTINDILGGEI